MVLSGGLVGDHAGGRISNSSVSGDGLFALDSHRMHGTRQQHQYEKDRRASEPSPALRQSFHARENANSSTASMKSASPKPKRAALGLGGGGGGIVYGKAGGAAGNVHSESQLVVGCMSHDRV